MRGATRCATVVRAVGLFWMVWLMVVVAPAPADAQERRGVSRIAATVNDQAITTADLAARARLAVVASGLPDTAETRERLRPQVLRSLIDETLQLQEANSQNVSVDDREVEAGFAQIAQQNNQTAAAFAARLDRARVPRRTLLRQIRANLAWRKLVQRRLSPSVQVTEEEIDAAIERLEANAGKPEYLVAEIFLGVSTPAAEAQVRALAGRLVRELRGGANFAAVARQFSEAAGAGTGGDLGWVQPGQLMSELDQALRQLGPGQLAGPIRSAAGFHILLLRNRRVITAANPADALVSLRQISFPARDAAGRRDATARVEQLRREVSGCAEFEARMAAVGPERGHDLGARRLGDLPPPVARVLAALPIGTPSPPLVGDGEVSVLIVCDRTASGAGQPDRDRIAGAIGNRRLEMLQQRYLRDLRRAAFIDVRQP